MIKIIMLSLFIFLLNGLTANSYAKDVPKPALMLANIYHEGVDLNEYWVSEKYDGVRTLWNGTQLVSRGGNVYHAPKWFTKGFPKQKFVLQQRWFDGFSESESGYPLGAL